MLSRLRGHLLRSSISAKTQKTGFKLGKQEWESLRMGTKRVEAVIGKDLVCLENRKEVNRFRKAD